MASYPMKVKAVYAYTSEHSDDLNFPEGQIITVTDQEDDDWYVGEYDGKSGLFPKNFVEKYEPAPPPRPTRAVRPKAAEPSEEAPADPPGSVKSTMRTPRMDENDQGPFGSPAQEEPAPITSAAKPAPASAPASAPAPAPAPSSTNTEAPPTPKPEKASPAKGPPPPTGEKSEKLASFKDRMAMFNRAGAAPIAPIQPRAPPSTTFIKKPYVAPPPSKDAYIPTKREPPPQKIYRREEDPEVLQRQAEDQEAAEKAGLVARDDGPGAEGEDAPQPVSLKERIALLQKQQQEQATRRAEAVTKKKPAKPPTKRTESQEPAARDSIDQADEERGVRTSADLPREAPARKSSKPPAPPRVPEPSDGNEADQSAAGETTEDAGNDSSTEEEAEAKKDSRAPPSQVEEQDEDEEAEEEEEEDEVDEEERRKMELRARMAKLSGGGGMGAIFGGMGPVGGMAMPGMSGPPASKKKKASLDRTASYEQEEPPARAPMVPIPGMGLPGMTRTMTNESGVTAGREQDEHPVPSQRAADEVPDVEDVAGPPTASRAVPPLPPQDYVSPQSASAERGVPPPVPGGRPSIDARPVPAPSTKEQLRSQSEGSEAGDEMPEPTPTELPLRSAPPPISTNAPPRPSRPSMDDSASPVSSLDRRASRLPPPIPVASPTMAPPAPGSGRGPPPPLPNQAPPRPAAAEALHRKAIGVAPGGEGESEYEGDYDTDIAPGEEHKDALRAHGRDSSLEESITMEPSGRSPHIPSGGFSSASLRAVPPLPPSQPPRRSAEYSRQAPPPIPTRQESENDYDPYSYATTPSAQAPPQLPRQPPPSAVPVVPAPPRLPVRQEAEAEDERDNLYAQPPRRSTDSYTRRSIDRAPPPLPPQAPPSHAQFEEPLATPSGKAPVRSSVDQERIAAPLRTSSDLMSRTSVSGHRPDIGDFIARDIDLGEGSQWWAQPNTPPPSIQGRSDVGWEIEEQTSSKRGGKTLVSKDLYILYQDYSQTIATARFDAKNPSDVQLEQRHEPPPNKLRQDELENYWSTFGSNIYKAAEKSVGQSAVGDGSAHAFVLESLKSTPGALAPVGSRAYGALVYANLGNASVQQFDEIRPGDIASFRNARLQGKHGGLHTKYSLEVAGHAGVIVEWDGSKKKLRIAEQGKVEAGKEKKERKKGKVELESYRLEDLRSGEVRVWRVVGREYVGWGGD